MTDYTASDWSQQDAGNTNASPNGVSGSYSPSTIAPIIRAIRGAAKRSFDRGNAQVTTTGTANALLVTYLVAPTAYIKGEVYRVWAHATNTGPVTVNVNSLGAKQLLSQRGQPMLPGQIVQGDLIEFAYDGTSFCLIADEYAVDEIALFKNAIGVGSLYHDSTDRLVLKRQNKTTGATEGYIHINGSGADDFKHNNATVWTAANDGSGSTLDSDLLDGQHGAWYRDLANATGTLNNARLVGNYSFAGLDLSGRLTTTSSEAIRLEGTSTQSPYLSFTREGTRQAYLQHSNTSGIILHNDITNTSFRLPTSGVDGAIFRSGSTDYTLWHTGNDGSGSGLDSDFLDGQHGTYYRDLTNSTGTLPDARLAASTYNMSALNLSNRLEIRGTAPYISFIDTTSGEYSARMSVNSNNIYLQSSTDDVNFSTVFQFELDTKRGYINGSEIHTNANHSHLSIGTSASSARTALGLGGLATENFSDLVYTGSSFSNTNFPIGSTVVVIRSGAPDRNAAITVRLDGGNGAAFTMGGSAAALSGTWRARGIFNDYVLAQRVS